jgi:hypothetical protein
VPRPLLHPHREAGGGAQAGDGGGGGRRCRVRRRQERARGFGFVAPAGLLLGARGVVSMEAGPRAVEEAGPNLSPMGFTSGLLSVC